jgi:hypothetical protein
LLVKPRDVDPSVYEITAGEGFLDGDNPISAMPYNATEADINFECYPLAR